MVLALCLLLQGTRVDFGCHSDVKDCELAKLSARPEIEELGVISDEITDGGLDVLRTLPKLRWLRLNSSTITDDGLKRLPRLDTLEIWRAPVTGDGLKALSVKSLTLYRVKIDDAAVAALKDMRGLDRLTLGQLSPESRAKAVELVTALPRVTITFAR